MKKLLNDPDESNRWFAVRVLSQVHSEEAWSALIDAALNNQFYDVRFRAVEGLLRCDLFGREIDHLVDKSKLQPLRRLLFEVRDKIAERKHPLSRSEWVLECMNRKRGLFSRRRAH
ncbi:HEAT repeat domain-containing protein [Candidatus Micrarchaeota archaeon]|nr:HEAT repeat domain-containing protein [Candidatus Micrarchaeota archaeon]